MSDVDQHFRTLGLEPGAPPAAVKEAYRDLVKIWHPDRFSNDPRLQGKAQEKLKAINIAYHALAECQFRRPPAPPREEATRRAAYAYQTLRTQSTPPPRREPRMAARSVPPVGAAAIPAAYDWFFRIAKILAVVLSLNLIRMVFVNCGLE